LNAVIVLLSLFLVGVILIQRGKGGGLAGAFGGAGGSSAFGTKAGDVFTRITVGVAIVWMFLLMLQVVITNRWRQSYFPESPSTSISKRLDSSSSRSKSQSKSKEPAQGPSSPESSKSTETGAPVDVPALPEVPQPANKTGAPPK
jgi:preprotein translocase subunit SecG